MAGLKSWSRTAASNVLANTGFTMDENMAPSAVNDSVRQLMADVKTEWAQGNAVASATTPDITGTATTSGGYLHITGTTTITGFATADAGIRRRIVFDGALQLTHNATSFILLTGANITTVAGDCAEFVSEGSGNWRMTGYERASGAALVTSSSGVTSLNSQTGAVDTTTLGNIGSIISAIYTASATLGNANTTVAGSSLRYNMTLAAVTAPSPSPAGQEFYPIYANGRGAYAGGGTALTGTWRKLNTGVTWYDDGVSFFWYSAIFVRIS